jgi:hypothetical protein
LQKKNLKDTARLLSAIRKIEVEHEAEYLAHRYVHNAKLLMSILKKDVKM